MKLETEIILAQKGDKEAFIRCIKSCEATMYRVAKSILKNDNDCADAIQETILTTYRTLGTLREPKFFKTWMIRILINEARKIIRKNKKVVPFESVERIESADAFSQVELQELIDKLEVELRVVVTLFYLEDLPVKDIAIAIDQPEGTIKSRLARARLKLAEMMSTSRRKGTMLQ